MDVKIKKKKKILVILIITKINIFQTIFLQRIENPRILKELIPLQKYSQKYQLIYLE